MRKLNKSLYKAESNEDIKLGNIKDQLKKANVTDKWFTKKEIKALPNILNNDEVIKYATSGLVDNNTVFIVCTNARILFLDKGMFYGIKSTEIPLDMVNSVSYSKGLVLGNISITNGAKTTLVKQIKKETAPIMADTIKAQAKVYKQNLHNPQVQPQKQSMDDMIVDLKKLKTLVDSGVITKDDFDAKKKKMLGI